MGRVTTPEPVSRGAAFRSAALEAFDLSATESQLLDEVAATLDEIDALAAAVAVEGVTVAGSTGQTRTHPAVGELRQHRLALSRLLAQLSLPDVEGEALPSLVQVRGRRAAAQRWAGNG